MRVAADESGLDLLEEALIAAGSDAGLSDARDPLVGIDEDDRLDGSEPRTVPHGHRLVLPQRRERDTDIPRADVGDFQREYSQGLITSTPAASKSQPSRVATGIPRDLAIPAIMHSSMQ